MYIIHYNTYYIITFYFSLLILDVMELWSFAKVLFSMMDDSM